GWTGEFCVKRRDPCLVGRNLGQRVLHHGVRRVLTDRLPQLLELGDGETAVLGKQNGVRVTETVRKLGDRGFLVRHGTPCLISVGLNRPEEFSWLEEKSSGADALGAKKPARAGENVVYTPARDGGLLHT